MADTYEIVCVNTEHEPPSTAPVHNDDAMRDGSAKVVKRDDPAAGKYVDRAPKTGKVSSPATGRGLAGHGGRERG